MQKESDQKEVLTEEYVRDHYDKGLQSYDDNYTQRRWFSSPAAAFDHKQTKFAFLKAMGGETFERGLEVGAGDGVWTTFFMDQVKKLELLDQSAEMLGRAKEVLQSSKEITYHTGNFVEYELDKNAYDLFVSVRCFEYILDKVKAVETVANLLTPGGKMVMITKNPHYKTQSGWKPTLLHTQQMSKKEWIALFKKQNLIVEAVYPAVFRWKSNFALSRVLFSGLQWIAVKTNGRVYIPYLTDWATESYTYVVRKKKVIVELYGLPGSGKTTLARSLEKEASHVQRLRPMPKGVGLVYFIIHNPGIFFFWMKEIIIGTFQLKDWSFFRYRLAILLGTFEAMGQAQKSRRGIVVIEEGLFQRITSIYELKKSEKELTPLIEHMPHIDMLVMVDATGRHFKRYNHATNPRGKRGPEYMEQLKDMITHNHKNLQTAFETLSIPRFTFGKETSVHSLYNVIKAL